MLAFVVALGLALAMPAVLAAGPVGTVPFTVEVARAGAATAQPPATGWKPVTLPDDWSARWPDFDGVAWYRLTWEQASAAQPLGMSMDYLNMAGAVYVNGTLVGRDPQLTEPLSRGWNTPHYWLLSAPLLRQGSNTALFRVSGLAAYQPGLGPVTIGDPAVVYPRFRHERWLRQELQLFSLAVSATLGFFFLALWLMRRQATVYGWFGAMSLTWWWYAFNQVATSPWPFATTDGWQAAGFIAFLTYVGCYAIFTLRFFGRRHARAEAVLWLALAAGAAAILVAPHAHLRLVRDLMALASAGTFLAICVLFIWLAWRSERTDGRILSVCIAAFLATGIHDLLAFLTVLDSNAYYAAYTSQLLMICMAMVLASRFVDSLRRIERFNDELSVKIEGAREELRLTLHRQHELEVANVRLGERLNLARDLHDGLGGTLVSSIATLEHAPHGIPAERFLAILKELRDDLRIVIDTASGHQLGAHPLSELIAPLRHRLTRLCESQRIDCRWQVAGIEHVQLSPSHSLDVVRILQEGVANVLKHSRASHVEIAVRDDGRALELTVADDGIGFDAAAAQMQPGAGLRSMLARAGRLGGSLALSSRQGATIVMVRVPRAPGDA